MELINLLSLFSPVFNYVLPEICQKIYYYYEQLYYEQLYL